MKRRDFLKVLSMSVLPLQGCAGIAGLGPAKKRPNILLIMSDDMGFSDLGEEWSAFY